ncbi:MAG: fused MFS/spermidine synthase [Candidatus Krumholzibacteriia bacterium]
MKSAGRSASSVSQAGAGDTSRILAMICFFFSGFAALTLEIAWIRKASLVFGSTIFATSAVLAVFFLGLSVGSVTFGKLGRKLSRPLRAYSMLEISLGILSLSSPYTFRLADHLYGVVYRAWAAETLLLILMRIVLVAVVILPPTILMGGTLPLFCRQFVVLRSKVAGSVGVLYGINTAGAAAGAATAGFWLLPAVGLRLTIQIGAAISILCGLIVRWIRTDAVRDRKAPAEAPRVPGRRTLVPYMFFAVGFVALGSEVLWTRYLSLFVVNTVHPTR